MPSPRRPVSVCCQPAIAWASSSSVGLAPRPSRLRSSGIGLTCPPTTQPQPMRRACIRFACNASVKQRRLKPIRFRILVLPCPVSAPKGQNTLADGLCSRSGSNPNSGPASSRCLAGGGYTGGCLIEQLHLARCAVWKPVGLGASSTIADDAGRSELRCCEPFAVRRQVVHVLGGDHCPPSYRLPEPLAEHPPEFGGPDEVLDQPATFLFDCLLRHASPQAH